MRSDSKIVGQIVAVLDADKALTTSTNMFLNMKEGAELGSLPIAIDLIRVVPSELLSEMPYPGTVPTGKEGVKGWGTGKASNHPDLYADKDGEKDIVRSTWGDLCRMSAIGRALMTRIQTLDDNKGTDADPVDTAAERAGVKKRLDNLILLYRKGGKIVQQIEAFTTASLFGMQIRTQTERPEAFIFQMPKMDGAPWSDEGTRYLSTSTKCIRLFAVKANKDGGIDRSNEQHVSLGTFLGYDVAKALQMGGELKHLLATLKRTAKTPGTQAPRVTNILEASDYLNEVAAWLHTGGAGERYTTLLQACNAKGGDQLIYAIGVVMDDIGAVYEKVKTRYEAMVLSESAAADAKAGESKAA